MRLYYVSDKGIASCVNVKTGEPHWRSRLSGPHSASPLYAEGHVYFQNENGLTTVIKPGTTFNKVAENQLDGRTFASIATVGKRCFCERKHTCTELRSSRVQRVAGLDGWRFPCENEGEFYAI